MNKRIKLHTTKDEKEEENDKKILSQNWNEIYLNLPKKYFKWKVEITKFQKLVDLIEKNEHLKLRQLLRESPPNWRELAIYLCCKLKNNRFVFELKNEMEDYSLFYLMSCLAGNMELCQELIETGVKVNEISLNLACISGNKNLVEFLLSKQLIDSFWLLYYSSFSGNQNLVEFFAEKYEDEIKNVLPFVCRSGNKDILEYLLSKCDDFNMQKAFNLSCRSGNKYIVDLLVSKGADSWESAFPFACKSGNKEIVEFLISKG